MANTPRKKRRPDRSPNRRPKTADRAPDNAAIARLFDQLARALELSGENLFRIRGYRRAADALRRLSEPAAEILRREGTPGLVRLPGIGRSVARSIQSLLETGRLAALERLRNADSGRSLLETVPGIGPRTAERLQEQLGIESLADLHAAAVDGRLEQLPGMGAKRVRAVIECLRARGLTQPPGPRRAAPVMDLPPVGELLDVDREYRERAARGTLPRTAPRRFNPTGAAWLPILHTERQGRHYTALYSNTAHAHQMGTTHDWVVIARQDPGHRYRCTVITSKFGALRDRRIVRGRESECREHYEQHKVQSVLPLEPAEPTSSR